jgi:transposase
VRIVDAKGKIVREAKVASDPAPLIRWLKSQGVDLARIGLEAGPLSQWLYAAMKAAGLQVELLETRHVRAADAGLLAALPSSCGLAGSGPCIANPQQRRTCARF